jgi:hypothetical protein
MSNINYTKALESDPAIITLAKEMNVTPKEVVAIVNQQRYRAAYNRVQQQRMKVVRRLVKEHPELMKEVG